MKLKIVKLLISVILLVASLSPVVYAPYDTASPSDSSDDAMITIAGNYFGDTHYLALKDENVDVITGIRFNGVDVPQGAKINNATLFVYNVYDHGEGLGTCTLYGDDADNSIAFTDSGSFTRVYTNEFVNWNISDIRSQGSYNLSITAIVQEIIDRPGWSNGNSLSAIILSASGSPRREFASEDSFYTHPYIAIWYDEEPPADEIEDIKDQADTPYNETEWDWEKNHTYRGIDVYKAINYGDYEILVVSSDTSNYFNTTKGDPNYVNWNPDTFQHQESGSCEFIASMNDWTFFVGQNGTSLYIYYSDDEFTTWRADRVNTHFPLSVQSNFGSIWADQTGSNLLHLVWSSRSAWSAGKYDIIYSTFTLDPVTENLVWSTSYFNVTENYGDDQIEPDLYQEKDGTIHVVWHGINGTAFEVAQYRRRQANGTWLDAVRLSGDAPLRAFGVDIVANEITGVALATWSRVNPGNWEVQWDTIFPNNTVGTALGIPDRKLTNARYVSVVNYREDNTAHLVYEQESSDQIHYRSKLIDNSTAWTGPQALSVGPNRHNKPSIGLDEINETLAVIWWNQDLADTDFNVFQIGDVPIAANEILLDHPLKYPSNADYFSRVIFGVTWWLVYPNGTLVTPSPIDPDDLKDLIDDLLGGAQPEDPEPEEYGAIGKFQWKLLVMAVGFIMLLGSPIAGIHLGASTATWIKLVFVMCFGLAILSQLKFM